MASSRRALTLVLFLLVLGQRVAVGWRWGAAVVGRRAAAAASSSAAGSLSALTLSAVNRTKGKAVIRRKKERGSGIAAKAVGEHALQAILSERCNVVLTHTNADFDSLAGAVALAKLWSIERPELPTHVVLPRGGFVGDGARCV